MKWRIGWLRTTERERLKELAYIPHFQTKPGTIEKEMYQSLKPAVFHIPSAHTPPFFDFLRLD